MSGDQVGAVLDAHFPLHRAFRDVTHLRGHGDGNRHAYQLQTDIGVKREKQPHQRRTDPAGGRARPRLFRADRRPEFRPANHATREISDHVSDNHHRDKPHHPAHTHFVADLDHAKPGHQDHHRENHINRAVARQLSKADQSGPQQQRQREAHRQIDRQQNRRTRQPAKQALRLPPGGAQDTDQFPHHKTADQRDQNVKTKPAEPYTDRADQNHRRSRPQSRSQIGPFFRRHVHNP